MSNREIKDNGASSPQALAAGAAYKASRVTATRALRAAAVTVAKRRVARFGGLPSTSAGLSAEPAPIVRTEAEVISDAVAAGRRLNLMGSDLDCYVHLVTRPDSQLAKVLQQTA